MESPKKLKSELPHDPAVPLLDIYTKSPRTRDIYTLTFTVALEPGYGVNLGAHGGMNGQSHVVHIHNGVLFIHKQE
jgi:hypothetical protein